MYQSIAYLKHLLTATNQHGVHSPFVYNYITKCLYAKPKFKGSKTNRILLKSISYFSIKTFKLTSKDSQIGNRIAKEFGLKPSEGNPFDLIYFDNPIEDILAISKDEIHNDSMILLGNINTSKNSTAIWKMLRQNEMVTVSIDMFHCGALFFRKEQAKEHFKIRI